MNIQNVMAIHQIDVKIFYSLDKRGVLSMAKNKPTAVLVALCDPVLWHNGALS